VISLVQQHACRTSGDLEYSFNSHSRMSCTASNGTCAAGLLAVVFAFLERLISLLNETVALTRFTSGVSRHQSSIFYKLCHTCNAGDTLTKALYLQRCSAARYDHCDVYASFTCVIISQWCISWHVLMFDVRIHTLSRRSSVADASYTIARALYEQLSLRIRNANCR
jgi:hypothetical protein